MNTHLYENITAISTLYYILPEIKAIGFDTKFNYKIKNSSKGQHWKLSFAHCR